ncbi:MAG TPA: hypothetical protein PLK90_06350 [Clostridiales bacterium]|nr:hypothetical protein [Clostridiales bacterium]HQP70004.1 hypothetical protein [Clostridiales bacterium]
MKKWMKLIALEWFVLRKDPKVRIKLMISFLLVLYVLLFSMVETGSNVLPFFFFGFFFVSPLIDYSFYMQRVRKRFPVLLGKGYTLTQIFLAKTAVIFAAGLVSGTIFTLLALYLNRPGILHAHFENRYLIYFITVAVFSLWMIVFSGLIQTRFEIIFPLRLLNIMAFILFVNFQTSVVDGFLQSYNSVIIAVLLILTALSFFLAGRLNKDKIV